MITNYILKFKHFYLTNSWKVAITVIIQLTKRNSNSLTLNSRAGVSESNDLIKFSPTIIPKERTVSSELPILCWVPVITLLIYTRGKKRIYKL